MLDGKKLNGKNHKKAERKDKLCINQRKHVLTKNGSFPFVPQYIMHVKNTGRASEGTNNISSLRWGEHKRRRSKKHICVYAGMVLF